MHEEALVRDLRAKVAALARDARPGRLTGVDVWVGALSHLDVPTLRRRWDDVLAGTGAEGASLAVERSDDPTDPRAQGVVLRRVRIADDGPAPGAP